MSPLVKQVLSFSLISFHYVVDGGPGLEPGIGADWNSNKQLEKHSLQSCNMHSQMDQFQIKFHDFKFMEKLFHNHPGHANSSHVMKSPQIIATSIVRIIFRGITLCLVQIWAIYIQQTFL